MKTLKAFSEWRKRNPNLQIACATGCFDLLHVGHIKILRECRKTLRPVVVGINSDASVRKLKGKGRPIFSENERIEMLHALRYVDHVVVFPETTATNFLKACQPWVWMKGGDYTLDSLNQDEVKAVKECGGEICIVELRKGWSTSNIIKLLS